MDSGSVLDAALEHFVAMQLTVCSVYWVVPSHTLTAWACIDIAAVATFLELNEFAIVYIVHHNDYIGGKLPLIDFDSFAHGRTKQLTKVVFFL